MTTFLGPTRFEEGVVITHAEVKLEEVYHYWVGDGRDGQSIWKHVLCQIPLQEHTIHGVFHVTIDKDYVGCQECLELLHS